MHYKDNLEGMDMDAETTVGTLGTNEVEYSEIEKGMVFTDRLEKTDRYYYAHWLTESGDWWFVVCEGSVPTARKLVTKSQFEQMVQAGDPDFRMDSAVVTRMSETAIRIEERQAFNAGERTRIKNWTDSIREKDEQIQRWREWRDRLVEDAHQMANEKDLCGEFDDFMEEHGLPRRMKTFEVTVQFTGTIRFNVKASEEADAESEAYSMIRRFDESSMNRHFEDEVAASGSEEIIEVVSDLEVLRFDDVYEV